MNEAQAPQVGAISARTSGMIELGKATEETRGCMGALNDFVCFMPLAGLGRD